MLCKSDKPSIIIIMIVYRYLVVFVSCSDGGLLMASPLLDQKATASNFGLKATSTKYE